MINGNIYLMPEEQITSDSISNKLPTRFVGRRSLCFNAVTSTMDIARQEALKQAPEGTAIFAEVQTKGRGRLKREWLTPQGNIAVSIILYPPKSYLNSLIMLSSLSVKQTIEAVTGLKCQLKWPNDILIGGRKVAGILIETKILQDKVDYVVIGIGINVNLILAKHPEIQKIATCLMDEVGAPVSRLALLHQLFFEMEILYTSSLKGASLYPQWRDNLVTLGKPVRARNGDEVFEGVAESVKEDGSLMLRQAGGKLLRFTVGDVTLRE